MKEDKSQSQLPGSELEEIQEAECLEMLARNSLGRIAFAVEARQEIFPVGPLGATASHISPGLSGRASGWQP